jgi:metallo-beta-lactamase family protein
MLAEILLEDSARLKEEDAEYANRKSFSKHKPALPLYTIDDVKESLPLFRTKQLKEEFRVGDFKLKFFDAGHILGAASVLVEVDDTKVLFSGDIGRLNDLLMTAPHSPPEADYIVMESTYGNKLHPKSDPVEALADLIRSVLKKKSVLLIPSFAVGRAQSLLYCSYKAFEKYPELKLPVFVNSPMAKEVTGLYRRFLEEHKLDKNYCDQVCSAATFISSVAESKELNTRKGPMIIISASGMLTGGRILHHLQSFGDNPDNIILLAGFQAAGTRGADLVRGERSIKFFGYYHDIKAEIKQFDFLSAHADQEELLAWLKSASKQPKKVFLSHGEPLASETLRKKIQEQLGLYAHPVSDMEEIDLELVLKVR